MAEVEKIV